MTSANIKDNNNLVIGTFISPGIVALDPVAGATLTVTNNADGSVGKVSGTLNGVVFINNKIKK